MDVPLKENSFYWANAIRKWVPIRNLTPGVPGGALKEVNFVKRKKILKKINNVIHVSA